MSYDLKRHRMFKWLQKLADAKAAYAKSWNFVPDIMTRKGFLYATNSYVMARVYYPEFENLGDDDFLVIDEYEEDGKHLELPLLKSPYREFEHDFFDRHFIGDVTDISACGFDFDARVMKDAIYPFNLYRLYPHIIYTKDKCELTAHDSDIDIKVLFMGIRR